MANNYKVPESLDPNTSRTIATDQITGVDYPVVKMATGVAGTVAHVSSAAPLPCSSPKAASVTIVAVTTAATGTNWTAFGSQACTGLDLVNTTGTAIEYRRGGAGNSIQVPNNASRLIIGVTNASDISVRRVDTSNTQVTLGAEAIS